MKKTIEEGVSIAPEEIEAESEHKINEEVVLLAERYAAALKTIYEYQKTWTEDDIEEAEKYLETLNNIADRIGDFTISDIEEAEKYLETLVSIERKRDE